MNIRVNNTIITSRAIMIVLSIIAILTTLTLTYLKFFTKSNIDPNCILFSLLLSIINVYLINK